MKMTSTLTFLTSTSFLILECVTRNLYRYKKIQWRSKFYKSHHASRSVTNNLLFKDNWVKCHQCFKTFPKIAEYNHQPCKSNILLHRKQQKLLYRRRQNESRKQVSILKTDLKKIEYQREELLLEKERLSYECLKFEAGIEYIHETIIKVSNKKWVWNFLENPLFWSHRSIWKVFFL